MLLNLHGELAEQPSSSTTQKGKNSLHAQVGKYLQTILAVLTAPLGGRGQLTRKWESLLNRDSASGRAVCWEAVCWVWLLEGFLQLVV